MRLLIPRVGVLIAFVVCFANPPCWAANDEDGFEPLYDGETLTGWDGDPQLWQVVDGFIRGATSDDNPIEANQFLIWKGDVDDFVLRLQFRIADRGAGNSGIQYRARRFPKAGEWVVGGYQADIERTNKYMGILYEERGRGILALRGEDVVLRESPDGYRKEVVGSVGDPKDIVQDVHAGEWQDFEIIARGNQLIHKLNGRTTAQVVDEDSRIEPNADCWHCNCIEGPPCRLIFGRSA